MGVPQESVPTGTHRREKGNSSCPTPHGSKDFFIDTRRAAHSWSRILNRIPQNDRGKRHILPMLKYSYVSPGRSLPEVSTRSASGRMVTGPVGVFATRRIGTIPCKPKFIVVDAGISGRWCAVLCNDTKDSQHPLFRGYTKRQVAAAKRKFGASKTNPTGSLVVALNALVSTTYPKMPKGSATGRKWMPLDPFIKCLGTRKDWSQKPNTGTVFSKKPSFAKTGKAAAAQKCNEVLSFARVLEKKINTLKCVFKTASELNPQLQKMKSSRNELRSKLTALYSNPISGDDYQLCKELACVRDTFEEEHKAAVVAALDAYLAKETMTKQIMSVEVANNFRFELDEWLSCILSAAEKLRQDSGTWEDVLIDAVLEPTCPFQRALGDYRLVCTDLLDALKTGTFGVNELNRNSLEKKAVQIAHGVQLLAAAAPARTKVMVEVCDAGKGFQREVRAIRDAAAQMSGLPTPSSVALRFDRVATTMQKRRWKQEILVNLLSKLAATPGTDSATGLHSLLTETLGLTIDPVSASVKRTDRSEWHLRDKQKHIVSELCWVWLLFDNFISPGGTANDFFDCLYGGNGSNMFGLALVRVFLAWQGEATKRVKHEFKKPSFKLPPGWNLRGKRAKQKYNKMLSGQSLTLALDALWAFGEMHLESTEIPTRSFAMLGGANTSAPVCTGADDDTLLQDEAIARFFQEIGIWRLFQKFGMRPHIGEEIQIVNQAEWKSLDSQYYDGNQLRNGLFFIYDYCGKDEIQDLRLYLLDSKVSGGKRKRNYAKTHGKNDVSVEIEIASQGKFVEDCDKQLFTRLLQSYHHLHPKQRSYTGSIRVGGEYVQIPYYGFSRVSQKEFDRYYFTMKQLDKDCSYKETCKRAFKRAKINNVPEFNKIAKQENLGEVVVPMRYPPTRKKYDHSLANPKSSSTKSSVVSRELLKDLISQFMLTGGITLRSVRIPNGTSTTTISWKLNQRGSSIRRKPLPYTEFSLKGTLENLQGRERLSGGKFTKGNIHTLLVLSKAMCKKGLEVDVSAAGRKLLTSRIMSAKEMLDILGVKSVLSGGVEQSVPHTLFRNEILAQRKREAHAGEFSHEEIGKMHYHLMPKMFPLCEISRGALQYARKRFEKQEIVFSLEGGVKVFPGEDLVEPTGNLDGDVFGRCGNMEDLSVHEQLQQNDWFCRIGTLCNLLSKFDKTLRPESGDGIPIMQAVYEFLTEIFGYDPRYADRKSQKDVVTAEAIQTVEALPLPK